LRQAFLRETRVETRVTRNLVENAKAEALADARVCMRAILGLLDPDDARAWRADGTAYEFSLGEGTIRVTLQDEAGKIDLNYAPDEILLGLFEAAGLSAGDAVRLVDCGGRLSRSGQSAAAGRAQKMPTMSRPGWPHGAATDDAPHFR